MAVFLEDFDVYFKDEDGVEHYNASQDLFISNTMNYIVPKAEKEGKQIVILSGAMGSGKSLAVQFVTNLLCLEYPNMQWGMGRISVQVARDTFFKELKVMAPSKALSKDNKESITYVNNSNVSILGWGDGNVTKIRSRNLHAFILEEVVEDSGKDGTYELNLKALKEVFGRVRLSGAPNIIFMVTNPSDPEHWLYREYIDKAGYVDGEKTSDKKGRKENVHVFYSVTTDNPHLDKSYKEDMLKNLSPSEAERMVFGKWVSLSKDVIYNEYKDELHWHPDIKYKINKNHPIILSWDFNVAKDKWMSTCIGQFYNDTFHMYDECVLEHSNTRGVLEELEQRGFFKQFTGTQQLEIMGDASGWAKHSGANMSDYGLIKQFIEHLPYKVNYKIKVPKSNPPLKARHNLVNAYLRNLKGDIRVCIYEDCNSLRRGLKTVQLKKGANYLEDQSNKFQDITTSFGYMVWRCTKKDASFKKST